MPGLRLISLVVAIGAVSVLPAQEHQDPPPPAREPEAIHWAVQLGMRSLQAEVSFPLVDRVVIVPDAATYLDELSRWSPQGRWPVLIEDAHFTPMFLRRIKPAQILLRDSVGALPQSKTALQDRINDVVINAWGGDPAQDAVRDVFTSAGYLPPGVVLTSAADPAWTAAAALAAGRGEPILWLDESYGEPGSTLDAQQTSRLQDRIEAMIRELGFPYEAIGDVLDTVTICRSMAGRVSFETPLASFDAVPERYRAGPMALTDVIGRHADGKRYAFTGWIFGSEIRCAYVAMCSMFLPRGSFDLIDTYSSEGAFSNYAMTAPAGKLKEYGFEVNVPQAAAGSSQAWRQALSGGLSGDVLLMNSRGNADDFHLAKGKVFASDVPLHQVPVAVHFTHSWSMQTPDEIGTIAGRWLDHGAYAYVGSMHEPLLSAFVPTGAFAERLNGLVPFLIAARWWEGEGVFSNAWRINTYGDPLMLCPSPGSYQQQRVAQSADYGIELSDHVREMMERIRDRPAPEVFAETIRSLLLYGQDDLAAQVWTLAAHKGASDASARFVLDLFFRQEKPDEFLTAWINPFEKNERQRDMFWHLLGPKLETRPGDPLLLAFESAIRRSMPQEDLRRLAPNYDRVFGRARVRSLMQGELDRAPNGRIRQSIKKLLETYPEQ